MTMRILCVSLLMLTLVRAEEAGLKGPGLEIGLVSECRSIAPGTPFTVGLHLEHFPGFHTYWRNPGMVGMETSLKWTLPEGFAASNIQWPYPGKTFMAEYPCHGYERDVTLLVTMTPPEKITTDTVTLSAEAAWMCCSVGCFPGFDQFTLILPVTEQAETDPKGKALIEKARKELPRRDHAITATLLSEVDAPVIRISFARSDDWPEDRDCYFFSNDRQISSDHPQKFQSKTDGTLLLEIPRSEFSPEGKRAIPGVLKIGSRAFALTATPKK